MKKLFICAIGDPVDLRLTGTRFFVTAKSEYDARRQFWVRHSQFPFGLAVVREVTQELLKEHPWVQDILP